jgi:N-acetyltransferase
MSIPVSDQRPDDAPWPALLWPPAADAALVGRIVELRPTDPEHDAADLFRALDDDAVWQHVRGRPGNPDEFGEILRARIAAGTFPWTLRLRQPYRGLPAGAVIGTSSYLEVSALDARLEIGSTTYPPTLWGGLVNPDAKLALLTEAFERLGAGRVQLKTDVRNERSQRAIARLGAQYEGLLRRYQRREDDTIRDTVVFSITVEDWPDVRSRLAARVAAADPTG